MSKTKEMVKIRVNGQERTVPKGVPLLQALIDESIEVPHFCYHPGIGVEGSCRLCLVQIEGMPKLATSCTVPVKEDLVVLTQSDEVKKARKGVLEFFLLNHPLDCPFCDKGGECPLQNFTYDSGQFTTRFSFEKIHKPKHQVIGEHIVLDKERCVLCNRCVRFGRDLTGKEELQIGNRGARAEIFLPEGTSLTTGFTGNYADICPVGALTTREFRFKARPWEMKTVNTLCGECSLGCNVQAWHKQNQLLRLTPRIEPKVNEWWLCDRGRFSIHKIPESERLKAPRHVGNGKDQELPKDIAAEIIAEWKKAPRHSLAFIADTMMTNEEFYQFKVLAKLAGDGRVFVPVSKETVEVVSQLRQMNIEDDFPKNVEEASCVLVLGERLEDHHPVLALRLRRLVFTQGKSILTADKSGSDFQDVSVAHLSVQDKEVGKFFDALINRIKGGKFKWAGHGEKEFGHALDPQKKTHLFLSDQWIQSQTYSNLKPLLEAVKTNENLSVSILLGGPNLRGILDQWDENTYSIDGLETDIQRGKVEGLVWLGKTQGSGVFDEYARGMRVFVHAVYQLQEAHPQAKWLLPLDRFPEKSGTYTNTFGRVQTLRSSTRVIQKGFSCFEMLSLMAEQLGGKTTLECNQVYEELAKIKETYPKTLDQIQESTKTYAHYERALWR